jgi:hypothetical protein
MFPFDQLFGSSKAKDAQIFETTRTWEVDLNHKPSFVNATWGVDGTFTLDIDGGVKTFSSRKDRENLAAQSQLGAYRYEGHQLEVYLEKGMGALSKDQRLNLVVDGSLVEGGPCETMSGLAGA